RAGDFCLRTARNARNANVTLTPSRVPGTRYSHPWCQPSTPLPKATRPWNEPANTIPQNRIAGIIAATVSAVSFVVVLLEAASRGVAVHPGAQGVAQDRPLGSAVHGTVDRPGHRGWQRDEDDLAALAAHAERPVAVFLTEVGDVR